MTATAARVVVRDKWTGEVLDERLAATAETIDATLSTADIAWRTRWPPAERGAALQRALEKLTSASGRIVETMMAETGFTRRDAEDELARGLVTLRLSAEEATRLTGETVSLDASAGFGERMALTLRVPIGVVLAITPFNTPLNGVLHKIAPALAAGNSVVLKPAELTPLTAELVVAALWDAGVPRERLSILHGSGREVGLPLLRDERVHFVTFTGSTEVGRVIKAETGTRPVALELGSIATTTVLADADLPRAVELIARGGFRKAGQVCTSVQRVFVAAQVADAFRELLVEQTGRLRAGDPREPDVDLGPVINEAAAERVQGLVEQTAAAGAAVLAGGGRDGSLVQPTLLDAVEDDMPLALDEVFGPVVCLTAVADLDEAIARVNRGRFGLQAGVFTSSVASALRYAREAEVGAVIVNSSSSTRADGMPFGGQKDSGFGKEGPRYAMRAMTVERLVMLGG